MAGGGAHFSFHGVGGSCTFTQKTRAVVLTCEGEDTTFTVEGDGALTGPKNSFLTRMTKTAL
jgi:carbon monoxide dehydrogenase subunit G